MFACLCFTMVCFLLVFRRFLLQLQLIFFGDRPDTVGFFAIVLPLSSEMLQYFLLIFCVVVFSNSVSRKRISAICL